MTDTDSPRTPALNGGKTHGVESILFADEILGCFSADTPKLGVSQIARMLHAPKARVHRFLISMEHTGYVQRDAGSDRYSLGIRLYSLGQLAVKGSSLLERVNMRAQELSEQYQYTAVVGMWVDNMLVVIRSFMPARGLFVGVHPGYRSPAYATAQGRVYLAFLSSGDLEAYLQQTRLLPLTPETITDPAALRAELTLIRSRLYAVAPDQANMGATAIAAPVFDVHGRVHATIALIWFSTDLPRTRAEEVGVVLREAGLRLSEEQGFVTPPEWQEYVGTEPTSAY